MLEQLFGHFSMAGHNRFLNKVSITFIDKTDPSDPLQREDYWRQTLKTGCFCVYLFTWQYQFFYTVMSTCFEDYDFKKTEFVLSVYIITSVIVSVFSLIMVILLLLLFALALLLLLLSLNLYCLF